MKLIRISRSTSSSLWDSESLSWVFHRHVPCEIPLLVAQQSSFIAVYLGNHQLLFQEFHFPFLFRFYQSISFHQAVDGLMLQRKSFVGEKKHKKTACSFNCWIWSGETENFDQQTDIFEFITSVNECLFHKWVSM